MAQPIEQVHGLPVEQDDEGFMKYHRRPIQNLISPALVFSIAGLIYLYKEESVWKKNEAVIHAIAGLIAYCIFIGIVLFQLVRAADEEDPTITRGVIIRFFIKTFYSSVALAVQMLIITTFIPGRLGVVMRWVVIALVVVILVGVTLYDYCSMHKKKENVSCINV